MQLPKELKNIYGFDGKVFKPIIVDDTSGSLVAIDYAHYEIHRGDSFSVADTVVCDTTTAKWQITTQSGPLLAHMVFDLWPRERHYMFLRRVLTGPTEPRS